MNKCSHLPWAVLRGVLEMGAYALWGMQEIFDVTE